MHLLAASLSTLATYLKASAPKAIAGALQQGTFQALLDLKRTLHLSNATIGYLQAFVMSSRNPTKVTTFFHVARPCPMLHASREWTASTGRPLSCLQSNSTKVGHV